MTPLQRLIAVNAAGVVAVLVVAELIFGTWFSGEDFGATQIPRLIDRRFDAAHLYSGGGVVTFRRDRYGLRGDYGRPEDVVVLTVGGSTTNERYVTEGQTWSDVLAAAFARDGRRVPVANGGAEGQSTIGHIKSLASWYTRIPGLRPRWVIAYVGVNDVNLEGPNNAAYDLKEPQTRWGRLVQAVANRSALNRARLILVGAWTARKTAMVHGGFDLGALTWHEAEMPAGLPPPDPRTEQFRAQYGARVTTLIQRIRDWGAEAVIVTQQRATYRREGGRLWIGEGGGMPKGGLGDWITMTAFNRAAMEACRAANAVCVDLGGEIEFAPGDFYDYVHTGSAGSRRIGEFLYTRLNDVIR